MFLTFFHFASLALCLFFCTACDRSAPASQPRTELTISYESEPQTLDPRRIRDLSTVTVIQTLYEGLMRYEEGGKLSFALAESTTVSPDRLTYTFKLRPGAWSNGDPVTAHDFERTWKSVLDPNFPSPNAYQLYPIRGARALKEGEAPADALGVRALDAQTLLVELEQPTPHFPQLTATHFYYPVHASLANSQVDPSAAQEPVTNGPYRLEHWSRHNQLSVVPNPYYREAASIRLDRITFLLLENSTALQLFQNGDLDWTGSPLSTLPADSLAPLKERNLSHVLPAAGVYLVRINTGRPPFAHAKMRRAFALALNRQDLVEHALQGGQTPALGLVPPSFLPGAPLFQDDAQTLARQLFLEALEEQGLTAERFPSVSIDYAAGERAHRIAQVAQRQWKDVLGIQVQLRSTEAKVYYDRLKQGDYQLGVGSWFADFRDPIAFLEVFKFRNNGTNNTGWEDRRYAAQLDRSAQLVQTRERNQILREADETLMGEMPLIPLFYSSYNYVKNPSLKGVYFCELGYLDLKNAHFD